MDRSGVAWSGVEWNVVGWSAVEWRIVEWSGSEWSKYLFFPTPLTLGSLDCITSSTHAFGRPELRDGVPGWGTFSALCST